ncbi:MAG: methyltransferase domain-containing protein [Proteobacteria bacterium]|nr:methyltransferase domain-containing protein [Pseudomonadota bacterium]
MPHLQYPLDVGQSDLERMTLLGSIYMPYNTAFILNNGLTEGMDVADIGCGPGIMSLWFSEQVGSSGKVVAIDNSDDQLNILRDQINKKHISNVITKNIDIFDLSNQINQQFDIIYCRFLMIHLQDPFKAIAHLQKFLKPQGCLIISELDNSTWECFPENEYLQKDIHLLIQTGKLRGSDYEIGKKLYSYFRKQNFRDIKVEVLQPVLENAQRKYLLSKNKAWGKRYLAHNLITEFELNTIYQNLEKLTQDQDTLLLGAKMFQVSGRNS